jgi:hypothetical protein
LRKNSYAVATFCKAATATLVNPHKSKGKRTMLKAIRASVLVLALAVSVYAGEMGNGITSPPPDQSSTSASAPTAEPVDSDMGNGLMVTTTTIIVTLLQTVLSLP